MLPKKRCNEKKIHNVALLLTLLLLGGFTVTGCSAEVSAISHAEEKKLPDLSVENNSLVGAYDSADMAVVEQLDTEGKQITLMTVQTGQTYNLFYSGTSYILDKYGSSMTAGQLQQGQIVNVTFLKSNRQIHQLQVAENAWKYDEITKYDLTGDNGTASIGGGVYSLSDHAQVYSNGHKAELMDIIGGDVLTISGVGHEIFSIQIDKGHGYVRLKNDAGLQGGWIEIGNEIISRVSSENMLLAVPEGTYNLRLRTDSQTINQEITVERNQELILDCAKIKSKKDSDGYVNFHLQPESASLSIDGETVASPEMVKLSYGIHEIEVSAAGYQTLLKHISVGNKLAEIVVNLEEVVEDEIEETEEVTEEPTYTDEEPESESDSKKNNFESEEVPLPENALKEDTETAGKTEVKDKETNEEPIHALTSNKVYVDQPKDVEIYLDGDYVGLAPTSFRKTTGKHTLTLRKVGYVTRSYTIVLHDDGDDITYSFSDLEPEDEEKEPEETPPPKEIIIEPEPDSDDLAEEVPSGDGQEPEDEEQPGDGEEPGDEEQPGNSEKPDGEEQSGNSEKPDGEEQSGNSEKPDGEGQSGNSEKPEAEEQSGNSEKPEAEELSGNNEESGENAVDNSEERAAN